MRIILKSFLDFFRDGGPMLAGAITGFFLMSFFPFCLLILSLLGYILGENESFYEFFSGRLLNFFPGATHKVTDILHSVVIYKQIGIFTGILYFYFSYQLFMTLESALNRIFEIEAKRSFLVSIIFAILFIISIIVLMIVSFAAESVLTVPDILQRFLPEWINEATNFVIGYVAPLVVAYVIVSAMYMILPNTRVSVKYALAGALFSTVLLEVAKHLFTLYMTRQAVRYGAIYGPLTAVIIFLLWVFYAACIFLIGGEVAYNLSLRRAQNMQSSA